MESYTDIDTKIKYCKDLLCIISSDPLSDTEKYVHAFSFSREVLQEMISAFIIDREHDFYLIDSIKLYIYSSRLNKVYRVQDETPYNEISFPIYGLNKMNSNNCEQVLVAMNTKPDFIEESLISTKPITIDTFYEDSILNA